MLITLKEMLAKAREEQFAVGAFNTTDLKMCIRDRDRGTGRLSGRAGHEGDSGGVNGFGPGQRYDAERRL